MMARPAESLWEWLDALALDGDLLSSKSDRIKDAAWFIAKSGSGTTGEGCTVDAESIAAKLGVGARSVERYQRRLLDAGWLERTVRAARGVRGERGRRARFRLSVPESSAMFTPTRGGRSEDGSSATGAPDGGERSEYGAGVIVRQISEKRPPNQGESSATAERERGGLPTSVGSTSVGSTGSVVPFSRQAQSVDGDQASERLVTSLPPAEYPTRVSGDLDDGPDSAALDDPDRPGPSGPDDDDQPVTGWGAW